MHIVAAEWILRLPEGRSRDLLDAGCKAVLIVLWSHTKWKAEHDATCEECYPSAPTIADATGSTLKATRKRLERLIAARWIRHERRANREWGWALAWREPFPLQGDTPPVPRLPLQGPTPTPPGSDAYPSRGTNQGTNQDTERSDDHTSASVPTPAEGHPCTVMDSPEVTQASPQPSKPRKRKPPKPDPKPDDVAELLDAHRLAHAEHVPVPAWPARSSKRYASMAAGCRKAVAVHGVEWCRRMLVWRAGVWARDPSQHPYSTADVWRPVCLEYAKRAMGGSARASPSRTLPVEPDAPSREYVFPWTEPNP